MANTNYQEPIEKKEIEVDKKTPEIKLGSEKPVSDGIEQKESASDPEKAAEMGVEKPEEKISEKLETARKTIGTQQTAPPANVASDAQSVTQIEDFEKKVEKLVELAIQKGPEHAIRVAQHMDKGKNPTASDNYTLDEIHDKLMEDELRSQLVQKGLLKEL
jgi:hypothetical protein